MMILKRKSVRMIGSLAIVTLLGAYGAFAWIAHIEQSRKLDALSFSNTMEWDPVLISNREESLSILPGNWGSKIALPNPPRNSSEQTREELNTLLDYRQSRTPAQENAIRSEINLLDTFLGPYRIGDLFDSKSFPKTAALLGGSFHDLGVVILREKETFDRVRPSFLDTRITPLIDIPGHPAYPSGHSTQSHFVALVLGTLDPSNAETYWKRADRIALDREIAGIHYPSDSTAGVLLARQLFNAFMELPSFHKLLNDARSEW
jgi:acid phosphatase (class A)